MKAKDLKSEYYQFGNRGTVWANAAHIAKSGESRTLCGTPMLSRNHARLEGLEDCNCKKCNDEYKKRISTDINSDHINEL